MFSKPEHLSDIDINTGDTKWQSLSKAHQHGVCELYMQEPSLVMTKSAIYLRISPIVPSLMIYNSSCYRMGQ